MKRVRIEKNRQIVTPDNHIAVQTESLYFRRPLGVCRGSGKENTSNGRVWPSRGRRDSVRDRDIGARFVGGGGG